MQTIESIKVIKQDLLKSGPCNLLITGPAGCGKSALANAYIDALEKEGAQVERSPSIKSILNELTNRIRKPAFSYLPIIFLIDEQVKATDLNPLESLIHQGRQYGIYLVVVKQSPNVEFRGQKELKHIHLGTK